MRLKDEMKNGKVRDLSAGYSAVLMLFSRTLLFFAGGMVILAVLRAAGYQNPLLEMRKWWYFQVIITNIVCFFLLMILLRKEKKTYVDLLQFDKKKLKEDIRIFAVILLPSLIIGAAGMFGGAYAIFGNFAIMEQMNKTPPLWAAYIVLLFFPATIALVELPLYFAYSFQRIESVFNARVLAFIGSAFFLALQHIFIPVIFDVQYMVWRFLSFLPLALFLGNIYMRKRRMLPLIAVHLLLDLQAAVMVFILSVRN